MTVTSNKCNNLDTVYNYGSVFLDFQILPILSSICVITIALISDKYSQFTKTTIEETDNLDTIYDYGSVLHYGAKDFTFNGEDTIKVINAPDDTQIGLLNGMSDIDAIRVNSLYQCDHGVYTLIFP